MNPEDDPEARIRELERPLSDVARNSELGTPQNNTAYLPPPTYPPPNYPPPPGAYGGTPYGGTSYGAPQFPPPQPPNRSRLWLLVAAVGVCVAAVAAGVVFYTDDVSTSGVAISQPSRAAGGGGAFDTTPSTASGGEIAPAPSVGPAVPAGPEQPAPGEQISVSGIGESRTLACADNIVSISGVSNKVTITGHCASLQVSGVSNVVTVDSAGGIDASGFQNRITFHSGQPEIGNSGSGNIVEQG
jgi:hypothetical protein